jgi:hypothetical protein
MRTWNLKVSLSSASLVDFGCVNTRRYRFASAAA